MTAKVDEEILIPSYFQEEWQAWHDYCSDGALCFAGHFEDWRRNVVDQCSQLTAEGKSCRFVSIPFDAFCDWSERNHHRTDAMARQEFASQQLRSLRSHLAFN
jgi:hypothetical protein